MAFIGFWWFLVVLTTQPKLHQLVAPYAELCLAIASRPVRSVRLIVNPGIIQPGDISYE